MATYVSLILQAAFKRSANLTDLASGVFGALVPCAFVLMGRPVPENASILVAEIAVGVAVGWIFVRLLAAPYLIWKSDQDKIKELQHKLDDPERLRRERVLNAQESIRWEFAREVCRYIDGTKATFMVHNLTYEILEELNSTAVLFNYDSDFETLWRRFVEALESEKSVTKIGLDRPDPDGFIEKHVNLNLNYFFQIRRVTGRAIVSFLSYEKASWLDCQKEMNRIYDEYAERGRVHFYDDSSLDAALSIQRPQGTGSETQP